MKKATFQLPGTTQPISKAYNESLSYDSNGNILKLERFGKKQVNQGVEIDDLTYTYEGNLLKKVTDATNNADGFKKGTHTGDDYTYDTFGNLKTDKNKGITNIKYNHLNLPVEIVFGNGKIEYIYSSAGAKVQKKVTQGTAVTTTDYLGGFQYTNNVLEFFPTPEGYYDARNSRYVYQYVDHLGNTRLSYSDINNNNNIENNEILSETDYYPFGLQHTENSIATTANKAAEKYQYNGKEFQDELSLNVFDYGARNYDAAIGRWFNHDPLSEVTLDPYGYTYNNPINLIDPTGMAGEAIETQYEDEEGKTLLNTKDGSDDVITIPNVLKNNFRVYNALYQSGAKSTLDSQEWNENMKASILGFETLSQMNDVLGGFTTQWSRQNAINYLQNPTIGNALAMSASESLSQWTDPEKLIMGASIFVGGISGGSTVSVRQGTKLIGPAGDAGAIVTRQVPRDWTIKSANKGAGTRFVDPTNVGNNVRVMRGDPNSPFINSRTPYTIRYMNGSPVDRYKSQIINTTGKSQNKSPNLHVPINNFKF